jgi:CRISPR-associated protein Cst1
MLETYQGKTRWSELKEGFDVLKNKEINNDNVKEYDDFFKKALDILKRPSYKAGYQIIADEYSDNTDVLSIMNTIKKQEKIKDKIFHFNFIYDYLLKHRKVLCMKDIVYSKVNPFWQNVSFLYKSNNKKSISKCYAEYFSLPAYEYSNTDMTGKYSCIECGRGFPQSNAYAMAWLNDVGVDFKRKKSYYWNYKADSYLCPICNIIYSCIPLGFYMMGSEGIFINNNTSINILEKFNNTISFKAENINELEKQIYYKVIEQFLDMSNENSAKNEIHNIQVIRKKRLGNDNTKFIFNNLSSDRLKIIIQSKTDFSKLLGKYIKVNDNYINIFESTISNIYSNISQFKLISSILRHAYINNQVPNYMMSILKIHNRMKRGDKTMSLNIKQLYRIQLDGYNLRRSIVPSSNEENKSTDSETDNKLRGTVYKLLNALKTNNNTTFIDILLRLYTGMGKPVPELMIEMQRSEEDFQQLGYAYLIGIKGEKPKLLDENKGGK